MGGTRVALSCHWTFETSLIIHSIALIPFLIFPEVLKTHWPSDIELHIPLFAVQDMSVPRTSMSACINPSTRSPTSPPATALTSPILYNRYFTFDFFHAAPGLPDGRPADGLTRLANRLLATHTTRTCCAALRNRSLVGSGEKSGAGPLCCPLAFSPRNAPPPATVAAAGPPCTSAAGSVGLYPTWPPASPALFCSPFFFSLTSILFACGQPQI